MASNMQSFPRMLKMMRENSNIKEKREALIYIRSNSKKLESAKAIKEEQYKELCKLVLDAFANGNSDIQNEAYETLNVIMRDFKDHSLNLFESMSQISQKNRLKILKLLEVVEDNAISTVAYDAHTVNFFNNCMCTIQTTTMPWTAPTACIDNLQALIEAESKPLSDDQRLEEETINYCITLLRRIYKVAAMTSDIKVQRFNALLLDKIMILAYMGHKRQRGPALKLLQQALATDILSHVRTKLSDAWSQYKVALQSIYCKRMLLLVSVCELDWATQWNVSIQFLGVDLHRGAGLINNLLSVEEKAFKSTDTIIRRQAFLSWKLLVDNFALDPQELATARRIKLLCIPLNAKNSKNELIALTKLEVWWHVIIKLYKDISKFVNPVITQFLNFCFGPLGDTPLLSSKFDIVASPGKRFFKTKVVAVDALCQLLVTKQENTVFSPILEERLPHSISDSVFQECYKGIIHSVGEALLVLSQLTDAEMKNRYQLGKILWTSLVNYIQETKMEKKELTYKDMVLVITELTNYAMDKPMIRNLILDTILFEVADLSKNFNFQDDTLLGLVLKLLQTPLLNEAKKNHYDALKCLFWQCIKSQQRNEYYSHAFKFVKEIYGKLYTLSNAEHKNQIVIFELWQILAEVLIKYMDDLQEINDGSATEHNLKTVESIVIFPFMYIYLEDQKEEEELIKLWKRLYKQFEMRTDLMATVKTNEILLNITNIMQCCLVKNEKSYHLILNCLDTLLSIVNYKFLVGNVEVPSIIHLIVKLIPYCLANKNNTECECILKALSAVLITIYGHNPYRVISYLQFCKPAIELILAFESETIANTWEAIVSIFKGLNKLVTYDLISCYKKAIVQGLNHSNLEIQTHTLSLFEIQNSLSSDAKLILEEIEKDTSNIKILNKSNIQKKNDYVGKLPNQVKMVGSFLNRESSHPKCIFEEPDKNDKVLPDSDSQDYVFIKTDLKFDVSRLTEHQKESLKRRREDIPALYNDLSQSSSQDTQNLQEWFDNKNKALEEIERTNTKKDSVSMRNILNDDANKENKIELKSEIIDKATIQNDTKLLDNTGQHVSLESIQTSKSNVDNNENSHLENVRITTERTCDNLEVKPSLDTARNDLGSDSQEEFLVSKDNDQRLSPSILDSGKRRNRNSIVVKSDILLKPEEINSNQPGQSNTSSGLQRTLRTKIIQSKSKMINKQKILDNMENKSLDEDKKGVKRKSPLDSESDGTTPHRRRKTTLLETASDSDSSKSTESDNTVMPVEGITEDGNLSQRTRNEISRLRINMVFDSPLTNSRRSKGHEENSKEASAKKQSPDSKGTKSKVGDTKSGDSIKKPQKSNDKELNSIQHTSKRGRPPKVKLKVERNNELTKTEDTKKTLQSKKNELEEKNKVQDDREEEENIYIEVASKNIPDTKCNLLNVKKFNKSKGVDSQDGISYNDVQSGDIDSNKSIRKNQDIQIVEESQQTQNDTEDIIANSQEFNLEKKCNEKQCFIKINKMGDIRHIIKFHEITVMNEETGEIVSNNCDNENNEVPKDDVEELDETNDVNVNKPKILTPPMENDPCDNENDVIFEVQKVNEESLVKSVFGFSSPKSNIKRQLKFKPYPTQGRAAHMLGLVTKQARMETECHTINIDDESAIKKTKLKDTDSEALLGRKERGPSFKEVDKVASCSSRQEKIFSNMRSSDYCLSPPIKLFSNLKNDGEKIFSKVDKSVDCESIEIDDQVENISDETLLEMEELPILEWSSANPPSLTASPSVSILKRYRQSGPEPDPESTTPNKRKRVSFADPPVSKEMGYDIATSDSPHKANKLVSRGLLGRKDSPLRLKQVKQRLIRSDSDKMETEEAADITNTSEIDLQCERENELLTKLAEELEYSENIAIDTDVQGACTSVELTNIIPVEINACNKIKIDSLNAEFEITQDTTFSKHMELMSTNKVDQNKKDGVSEAAENSVLCVNVENTEFDESVTHGDIFNGKDTKHSDNIEFIENTIGNNINDEPKACIQNISLDSLKFNITDDSIINHSSENHTSLENLEDTVDAGNLTSLNSTASSDEIFCGRLIRTSTQAVECTEEQDTLPVTDSVFGSLPLSQNSQNPSEFDVEIPHPELLDSIHPIYPTLISCTEPINCIIEQLTNPLWVQNLSSYLANRKLQTIGDLAQLSEREVNRIPVKGNSKVEFVKSILKCFEKTYFVNETSSVIGCLDNALNSKALSSVNMNVPVSTAKIISQDQSLKTVSERTQTESENHNTLVTKPSSSKVVDNVIATDKNAPEQSTNVMESTSDESSNAPVLEVSILYPGTSYESVVETKATSSVSTKVSNSSNLTTTQMINVSVPSAMVTNSTSEATEVTEGSNSSDSDAISIVHSMKTVGTCTSTDSVYLSKTMVNKATKSVGAQMALEDLLDEIDVNLVLESAVRRCTPEKILLQYKNKMIHVPQMELEKETIRMLGVENRKSYNEATLKTACRACGVNKVLLRLPDIFSADKQFFVKVLNAYRKKIKTSDCLNILDFVEVKDAVCQKCSSSDLAEMLSIKLKEEEQEGIRKPMTELSSLDAMLKRMPMDVIISHTVANDELIPSRVVLDIALQNNSPSDIAQALESQSPLVTKNVFDKLWSSQFAIKHIEESSKSKEDLLNIFKVVSSKLNQQDLLKAFYECMNVKVMVKEENDINVSL
ncbi:uncharacterized protein LOC143151700 isoform X2 [Ptiloglossa arizonensis]|uniref:uncharacterized protein LOC143151700 isoform X2 n=1 Tax=Ptiloglossa arizonensis TaxID=3350558 RepID=UPI003FA12F20